MGDLPGELPTRKITGWIRKMRAGRRRGTCATDHTKATTLKIDGGFLWPPKALAHGMKNKKNRQQQ